MVLRLFVVRTVKARLFFYFGLTVFFQIVHIIIFKLIFSMVFRNKIFK